MTDEIEIPDVPTSSGEINGQPLDPATGHAPVPEPPADPSTDADADVGDVAGDDAASDTEGGAADPDGS